MSKAPEISLLIFTTSPEKRGDEVDHQQKSFLQVDSITLGVA